MYDAVPRVSTREGILLKAANLPMSEGKLTTTRPAISHKPRQAGADVGGASAVAAEGAFRNVTVVTSCLALIHRK